MLDLMSSIPGTTQMHLHASNKGPQWNMQEYISKKCPLWTYVGCSSTGMLWSTKDNSHVDVLMIGLLRDGGEKAGWMIVPWTPSGSTEDDAHRQFVIVEKLVTAI